MTPRNPCRGWRHGDPVTAVLSDGREVAKGRVVVRRSERTDRDYVQVELLTKGTGLGRYGAWVWPEGWVIGQGQKRGRCMTCGQAFRTDDAQPSGFCLACDRQFASEVGADSAIRKPLAYLRGARSPQSGQRAHTDAELAAISAEREADEKASPF